MTTRTRIRPGDGDPRHGSVNGYSNCRCRCGACRSAWANYCREQRRQRVAPPRSDPRHGLYTTYDNHGCRCGLCRAAKTAYERDRRLASRLVTP